MERHIAVMFYFDKKTIEQITHEYPMLTEQEAEDIIRIKKYDIEINREMEARKVREDTVLLGHQSEPYSENEWRYGLFGRDSQQFFLPPKYKWEDVKKEQS